MIRTIGDLFLSPAERAAWRSTLVRGWYLVRPWLRAKRRAVRRMWFGRRLPLRSVSPVEQIARATFPQWEPSMPIGVRVFNTTPTLLIETYRTINQRAGLVDSTVGMQTVGAVYRAQRELFCQQVIRKQRGERTYEDPGSSHLCWIKTKPSFQD